MSSRNNLINSFELSLHYLCKFMFTSEITAENTMYQIKAISCRDSNAVGLNPFFNIYANHLILPMTFTLSPLTQ